MLERCQHFGKQCQSIAGNGGFTDEHNCAWDVLQYRTISIDSSVTGHRPTWRDKMSRPSQVIAWRKCCLSHMPGYSNFAPNWVQIWWNFTVATALQPRWRNKNFVRRVTMSHGWQIDRNCTVLYRDGLCKGPSGEKRLYLRSYVTTTAQALFWTLSCSSEEASTDNDWRMPFTNRRASFPRLSHIQWYSGPHIMIIYEII
jgi:hypothetical protein